MSRKYAQGTRVDGATTRHQIEKLLKQYRSSGFAYFETGGQVAIAFEREARRVLFRLPIKHDPKAYGDAQQQMRARWRSLLLVIKAKLVAVDSGITSFEQEFLAHIVLPDGSTVYEHTAAKIARAYESGAVRPMLEGPKND